MPYQPHQLLLDLTLPHKTTYLALRGVQLVQLRLAKREHGVREKRHEVAPASAPSALPGSAICGCECSWIAVLAFMVGLVSRRGLGIVYDIFSACPLTMAPAMQSLLHEGKGRTRTKIASSSHMGATRAACAGYKTQSQLAPLPTGRGQNVGHGCGGVRTVG